MLALPRLCPRAAHEAGYPSPADRRGCPAGMRNILEIYILGEGQRLGVAVGEKAWRAGPVRGAGGQRQQAVTAAQLASFPHPPDIAHNCNQIPLRLAGQTSLVDIAIFHNELIVMN